jgi:hydroxymethylbilane synthase
VPVVAQIERGKPIRVGARGSQLSTVQTQSVIDKLQRLYPDITFEFKPISTRGDFFTSDSDKGDGIKGQFVKEIEDHLLAGTIDLGVHSAKDLASKLPDRLVLGPALERAEPWDVLISKDGLDLGSLPDGSSIGTSSIRRQAFLSVYRQDLIVEPLRGNVGTRLGKVGTKFTAIVLAKAGLTRLNEPINFTVHDIPKDIMLPAPGQGQLALEYRESDEFIAEILQPLQHLPSALAMSAERGFTGQMGIGCTEPIAAYCYFNPDGHLVLEAALVDTRQGEIIKEEQSLAFGLAETGKLSGNSIGESKQSLNRDLSLARYLSLARKLGQSVAEALLRVAPDWFLEEQGL